MLSPKLMDDKKQREHHWTHGLRAQGMHEEEMLRMGSEGRRAPREEGTQLLTGRNVQEE